MTEISISKYSLNIEREPLFRPFHFKGGFFTEKWLVITKLETSAGLQATGVGGMAILWSDPDVFSAHSETGGNIVMAALAERAARLVQGRSFSNPIELIESILPDLYGYGQKVSGKKDLRKTFVLNSLISLDSALWKLFALENNIRHFHNLIPPEHQSAFDFRQEKIAHVPAVAYNYPVGELQKMVDEGYFFLKVKIGQAGSSTEMLEKDKNRLSEIHQALKERTTAFTESGKILYYLDANGRYPEKDTLKKLLDHADKIGMLEQIALLEEPFSDELKIDVSELPVVMAADESLHSLADVDERIDLGYRAIAIKPEGKTLSMAFTMGYAAFKRGIPIFVADSGCVPLLVEWNKIVAAHVAPFPGLSMGILESNGAQMYKNWDLLVQDHPCAETDWISPRDGIYHLDADYYDTAGGIFSDPGHYQKLVDVFE